LPLLKKCVAFLIVLVLMLSATITPMAANPVGDLDGDNAVSAPDLSTLTIVLLQGVKDVEYDVNGDDLIDIRDLVKLKKILAFATTTVSAPVVPVDGKVPAGGITLSSGGISAFIPEGVLLEDGVDTLTLKITPLLSLSGDLSVDDSEKITPYDIHISGVSKENTVPIIIDMGVVMPKYLNMGNYRIYHVEDGENKLMTLVDSKEELTAHNQFTYDPNTGAVTVAMATFSEVALVANTENVWNGEYDYSWYKADKTQLTIANADQLAAFGKIVGGMAEGYERDSFDDKTVKLLSDIDLGDAEDSNVADKIFYPIGYYNSTGSYDKVSGGSVSSTVYSFEGTFDGNGHKIANFYQNTWEMFGDYNEGYSGTPNHYKDAMGLFGYVVDGTVKNLTIDNFSSDGEFTPTGVIAAFAVNSTFENIAIKNCNPRVYNTGNGGIVGIGGNSDDPETYNLTFNNITIDNTNKITALWGSWDVACGGLVGMFRGAGHAYMENCHVAAQIDVYNDVCGNYQYYWYRYSGMMIGTNKNMVTDANGYTVPETSKYHAVNCTVHFGDWNDYYYCELVANSLASYTHDHQFSRLTEVDSIDVENMTITVDGKTTAIPTSGRVNYVVVNGAEATENATCYHFVDGAEWTHDMAGVETVDVDGDGVKETVLKEDRQHYYLPFNQLFTGYGWGVKHIPVYNGKDYAFDGITILDREVADSVEKFVKGDNVQEEYLTETTVTVGDLFKAAEISDAKLSIKDKLVQVFVSPASDTSTACGTYTPNLNDWTKGTITLSGAGKAAISITDYYFCNKTTIEVNIKTDIVNGDFNNSLIGYSKTQNLGTFEVIDEPGNAENKILHVTCGTDGSGYWQTVNVEKNTDYVWTFRMKDLHNDEGATRMCVHPEDTFDNYMITSVTDESTKAYSSLYEGTAAVATYDETWQKFTIRFNSGDNAKVKLWHNMWVSNREVYMDDWTLTKASELSSDDPDLDTVYALINGDFENGIDGFANSGVAIFESIAEPENETNHILHVKGRAEGEKVSAGGGYSQTVNVEKNTDYVWTFRMKNLGDKGSTKILVHLEKTFDIIEITDVTRDDENLQIETDGGVFVSASDDAWHTFTIKFNSGENNRVRLWHNMWAEAREVYMDDWTLTKAN